MRTRDAGASLAEQRGAEDQRSDAPGRMASPDAPAAVEAGGPSGAAVAGMAALNRDGFALDLLDALPDATAVLDRTGHIVAVNRVWRMFAIDNGGSPETTGVGVSYIEVCERAAAGGSADAAQVVLGLRAVLAGTKAESDREYPCPSDTALRWFTSRITPIRGSTGGAVVAHVNISRRKMSELELLHQASHDPLTGLANRVLFNDRLAEALTERSGRNPGPDVGLVYVDLDEFKQVNDTYGHDAGDEVLLAVTYRLLHEVRPQDTVARLGGDEFAICAPRITADGLAGLVTRLDASLAEPHQVHGDHVTVRGSVGGHLAAPGDTIAKAVRAADQAMYMVKNARFLQRSSLR